MKTKPVLLFGAFALAIGCIPVSAQLTIPSDGSDQDLAPVNGTNLVIDLSQASPGTWSAPSASPGLGIYDSNQWAVVFKYRSVNISNSTKITFLNHPTHAPVVWLVQSNVTIEGTVNLTGGSGALYGPNSIFLADSGPGGFRGGPIGPLGTGSGLGPGGGAAGGSHATWGAYSTVYGNPFILPLIGGSGASASGDGGGGGGAGGGAILIAASGSLVVNGTIAANGGFSGVGALDGSGGAIKLIANQISGHGTLSAIQDGRIRIETPSMTGSIVCQPEAIAVPPSSPPVIWPPVNAPRAYISSVDTSSVSSDPKAPLSNSADVAISNDAAVNITVTTLNFPLEGRVDVRVSPKWSTDTWLQATYVSGTVTQATWVVHTTLVHGYTVLQARITSP